MILGVVIGNTNIKIGYIENDQVISYSYKNDSYDFSDIKHLNPTRILLASVVPNMIVPVSGFLRMIFGIPTDIVRKEDIPINLEKYDTSNIGIDRVLSSYGVSLISGSFAVFDLGTAISISVVDKNNYFLGGAILPGAEMGLDALGSGTALLPTLDISFVDKANVIGVDTKECLASGAIYGTVSIIEGMVKRIEKELNEKIEVVLTGGFAPYVVDHLDIKFDYRPNITLEGLLKIK